MNYKTIRYLGHFDRVAHMSRERLRKYLMDNCPPSYEDIVILYASAYGNINGRYKTKTLVYKWENDSDGLAIQNTTAMSCCAIVELLYNDNFKNGLIKQENINLATFESTYFGNKLLNKSVQL